MGIRKDPALTNIMRKLISAFQPWAEPSLQSKDIPYFNAENERLFWQERKIESLSTLKSALALGAVGFLCFMLLGTYNQTLNNLEITSHLAIVFSFALLFNHLQQHPQASCHIAMISKIAISIYILNLIATFYSDHHSQLYTEIWTGLLPIYFLIYGQLLMRIIETLIFGWMAMLALPLSAYISGVNPDQLLPSFVILFIANLFGFCTRYQLENQSRLAFLARCRAEGSSQEKSAYIQHLSHNLRQPLQALSSNSTLLDNICRDKPSSQLQHIASRIGHTTDELINAFNHILAIENLENGNQVPSLKAVDINLVLAAMIDQFTQEAQKRNLNLKIILRINPPYNVWSDDYMLRQIISNLLDNALKYTPSGWIIVAAIKINPKQLKLHIRDSGVGITEADKPNIFKDFYRGKRRFGDPSGCGIGLTYVQKAINILPKHSLNLVSKINQGSDFQVYLPIADATHIEKRMFSTLQTSACFVFIVEDNAEVLAGLAQQISNRGCLVQTASCKAEVIAKLKDNLIPPDLLITDFYLDNKETAHDIIAAVHEQCGQIPVLILSALAIANVDKMLLPENARILRKPASEILLFEKMNEAMGRTNINV
jgi:signal transduction histidine kinase/CheY-like chemotaxis protein